MSENKNKNAEKLMKYLLSFLDNIIIVIISKSNWPLNNTPIIHIALYGQLLSRDTRPKGHRH